MTMPEEEPASRPPPLDHTANSTDAAVGPSDQEASRTTRSREIDSQQLLHGAREVLIIHGDETYRLRQTKNGKLILQK